VKKDHKSCVWSIIAPLVFFRRSELHGSSSSVAEIEEVHEHLHELRQQARSLGEELHAAAAAKDSLMQLRDVASSLRSQVDSVVAMLPQPLMTREQQTCIKDTFTCCICRGKSKTL
jgi:hypothetical protein